MRNQQRFRVVQLGQECEVCVIAECAGQNRPVDAVRRFQSFDGFLHLKARSHQDVRVRVVPDFVHRRQIVRDGTFGQVDAVTAQYDHIFIQRGDVQATPLAVVLASHLLAVAPGALEHPVDLHARHLAPSARALQRRVQISKFTLERVRYVVTNSFRAVEDAGQVPALVLDAREVLRRLNVDPITGFIRRRCAIAKQQRRSISTQVHKDLQTRAGALRQAPLPARSPITFFFERRARRCAHYGCFNNL